MRKTLSVVLTAFSLLGLPNIANCQDIPLSKTSASHQIGMSIEPLRRLDVDAADNIIGIGLLSYGAYFPESRIDLFRNGSRISFNDNIRNQYYTYLNHPEIARIDWSAKQGWHYYPVNPEDLKDYLTKLQASISNGTFVPQSGETLEKGVLYRTITERD